MARPDTLSPEALRAELTEPQAPWSASPPPSPVNVYSVGCQKEKISIAKLPVTGSDFFGRYEDIGFLDAAWAARDVNVATVVAWAGVGKSTLINHWLRGMAASIIVLLNWFSAVVYRQGSSGEISSADELIDTALDWFGDPDPRVGTAWQKGERLADLIARRRTLLILDGLQPLQYPPGSQEGRLRDPSIQALLRELAAFNSGLCVIITGCPSPILPIMNERQRFAAIWSICRATQVPSCSARSVSRDLTTSCKELATSLAATASL